MTSTLPNPFACGLDVAAPRALAGSPCAEPLEQAAAVVGDAPAVAATPGLPPDVFKPDMNRLYLDIVFGSGDVIDARPLFLRQPFKPQQLVDRKVGPGFIATLIDLGRRD